MWFFAFLLSAVLISAFIDGPAPPVEPDVRCENCGAEIIDDDERCVICGSESFIDGSIEEMCDFCGAELLVEDNGCCPICGTSHGGDEECL